MVVVHDIIASQPKGISFNDIKSSYITESVGYEKEIQKSELQPKILKKILLNLISSGVVEKIGVDEYHIRYRDIGPLKISEKIQEILYDRPGQYSRKTLTNSIVAQFPGVPRYGISTLIGTGIGSGEIVVDKNDKLSLKYSD